MLYSTSMDHVVSGESDDADRVSGLAASEVEKTWVGSALLVPQLLENPGDVLVPGVRTIGESITSFLQA